MDIILFLISAIGRKFWLFNKELVKRNFSKCVATYNDAAVVQKQMAERLVKLLLEQNSDKYNKVLEVGAGTGLLTDCFLRNMNTLSYFANDIICGYHAFLSQIHDGIIFLDGDIEEIDFGSEYDAIIANAVFQWIQNKKEFIRKIKLALKKGGVFAFSTFGENNFIEIRDVFDVTLEYLSVNDLHRVLSDDFVVIKSETKKIQLCFDSLPELLVHIRNTGVNNIGHLSLTKSRLQEKELLYRKLYSSDGKITLTYEPIWILCRAI